MNANEIKAINKAQGIIENHLRQPGALLNTPDLVKKYLVLHLALEEQEIFSLAFLDIHMRLIAYEPMFVGSLTECRVYPREVIKAILHHNAAAIILSHNHPGGVAYPSQADRNLTSFLSDCLKVIDVKLLDHIIVAGTSTYSFADKGLL
ncbi:JAB domain-containing protein [Chromobacterium sp.]|uniref:JAB domain-containing protein n=1 Tax=Chromobacterium sp. TaxID=306190 RepID=UPI0035AF3E3D